MTKSFCDRCGKDITGITSACVSGIADADADGGGTITLSRDLCVQCYATFAEWVDSRPAAAAVDPHGANHDEPAPRV